MGLTFGPTGYDDPGDDGGHPGPGALGTPADVRRAARAGGALRVTALAAMAPLVAALGYGVGSTPLAITMVLALAAGVAAGVALDLDRWFTQLPGLVVAVSVPMLLAVVAVLTGAGSAAVYPLLLHLGAFLWGLDWGRVGRLRGQTFLLVLPVGLALFADSAAVRAGSVLVFLLVLATLALASRDELRAVPRLAVGPRPAAATPTGADLLRAAGVAVAVGALAWLLLDGRSIVPPSPPDVADRLSFGDEQASVGEGGSGSGTGGSEGGGGASGGVPGFVPNDPGGSVGEGLDGLEGSGSPGGSGSGSGDLPLGGGSGSGGSGGGADSEALDLDGDGLVDGFDLDGDGSIDVDPDGNPVDGAAPDTPGDTPEPPWVLLLALLLAAVAFALAIWWWRTRDNPVERPRPGWAEVVVARLGREGARRGRPRAPPESVLTYVGGLADGPLPDDRLRDVGRILSSDLFGGRDATPEERVWVEDVVTSALAAHPAPGVASAARARLVRTGAD